MTDTRAIDRRRLLAWATAAATFAGKPVQAGRRKAMAFDDEGVRRLELALNQHVAAGSAPGLVGLLARGSETRVIVAGRMALDAPEPMRRDAIFRLASMTKPFTAVAALMLAEEGRFRIDEPAERLLPELADRRVLTSPSAPPAT